MVTLWQTQCGWCQTQNLGKGTVQLHGHDQIHSHPLGYCLPSSHQPGLFRHWKMLLTVDSSVSRVFHLSNTYYIFYSWNDFEWEVETMVLTLLISSGRTDWNGMGVLLKFVDLLKYSPLKLWCTHLFYSWFQQTFTVYHIQSSMVPWSFRQWWICAAPALSSVAATSHMLLSQS